MNRTPLLSRRRRGRTGLTLTEVMIASAISSMVAVAIGALSITAGRMARSIGYQEMSFTRAKETIEMLNRQIRMAEAPLIVLDADGDQAAWGNRLEYQWPDEAVRRSIELTSTDDDMASAWDNRLIFDPDISSGGDEFEIGTWLTPLEEEGAFFLEDATQPLQIRMRCGDSLENQGQAENDSRSGPGMQGMEINLTVAPRN